MEIKDITTIEDIKVAFGNHYQDDLRSFGELHKMLEKSSHDRDEKPEEILRKISDLSIKVEPVSKAFETSRELSTARMKKVISASQYLNFVLKVAAILAIAWAAFKFGVMNITK